MSHYSGVFFLYLMCLPLSPCQFTLHLWDFCSLRATTDNSLGISVRAIVCCRLWVRKKWDKFNLKAFDYAAWSGKHCWHGRASSKRKLQPVYTYASTRNKNKTNMAGRI